MTTCSLPDPRTKEHKKRAQVDRHHLHGEILAGEHESRRMTIKSAILSYRHPLNEDICVLLLAQVFSVHHQWRSGL